jgi:hypothetical protein
MSQSTKCELRVTSGGDPLREAWVYLRRGGDVMVLRADGRGKLRKISAKGKAGRRWTYSERFTIEVPCKVELYWSAGAKPLPKKVTDDLSDAFVPRDLALDPPPAPGTNQVAPVERGNKTDKSTLVLSATVQVDLPAHVVSLETPKELGFWPCLWERPSDAYYTDGIAQGAAWHGARLTENDRPTATRQTPLREQGLTVEGAIDAAATKAFLRVIDDDGAPIDLRASAASTMAVKEIELPLVTSSAANATTKTFSVQVWLDKPTKAFGKRQIVVYAKDGLPRPVVESFYVHLVGLQTTLVDDAEATLGGDRPGPTPMESDEVMVVDFTHSPEVIPTGVPPQDAAEKAQLTALMRPHTRVRRMIRYPIRTERRRTLDAASTTLLALPEMPMWMAELHLVGLEKADLEELLVYRKYTFDNNPLTLDLAVQWDLELAWAGPDRNDHTRHAPYDYEDHFSGIWSKGQLVRPTEGQVVRIVLDDKDTIAVDGQGKVNDAFTVPPEAIPFPTDGRRVPAVFVDAQSRSWGRADAGALPTVVVEWQVPIMPSAVYASRGSRGEGGPLATGDVEIMRGGNGVLRVSGLRLFGERLDDGSQGPQMPLAVTPAFRVYGKNPSASDFADLFADVVPRYLADHAQDPGVADVLAIVPAGTWQEVLRRILHHESDGRDKHFFDWLASAPYSWHDRRHHRRWSHGWERDMPLFGAPHGYGVQQRDPHPNSDLMWSVLGGIQCGAQELVLDKAIAAFAYLSRRKQLVPGDRADAAALVREAVREYNGGNEFHSWNGQHWTIQAAGSEYCNSVLDGLAAHVVYGPAPTVFLPTNYYP